MSNTNNRGQNQILAALPVRVFERLAPVLDYVPMEFGEVLHEHGRELENIYFPTTSIISLQHGLKDGTSAEVASIGSEGMLDVSLYTASKTTFAKAIVQIPGHGFRVKAPLMLSEMNRSGQILRFFLRYTGALISQVSQAVYCHRHHAVEQRLCRWILLVLDRIPCSELQISPEKASAVFGVPQESVKKAIAALERASCIVCHPDRIIVIDRAALEAKACECYKAVKLEFRHLQEDIQSH